MPTIAQIGIKFGIRYEICVKIELTVNPCGGNSRQCSPLLETCDFVTMPDSVPSSPPRIASYVSGRKKIIKLDEPEDANGEILRYHLKQGER